MAEYLIDKAYLVALADAIRKKSGSSSKMTPSAMVSAINNLGDMTYTPQSSPTVINKTGELYTIQDTTFNSLAKAIRNKAGISDKMTPHKMIDVVNGLKEMEKTAFAVYSADDSSLSFYKRSEVPKVGGQFEGKTATEVYVGIEDGDVTPLVSVYAPDIAGSKWPCARYVTEVNVIDPIIAPRGLNGYFANFETAHTMNLAKLDTSNVTNMKDMFSGCSSLTSLDLSCFNTSSVTDMSTMFRYCLELTTLNLYGFDTSSVEGAYWMFLYCNNLKQVTLGDKFIWVELDACLPAQNASNIPNADGKWYAASDGKGYAPREIPSNKADTYYAYPPQAFAVYSADDKSLNFYKRFDVPKVGEQFDGKTVSEVFEFDGEVNYNKSNIPWQSARNKAVKISFNDRISPTSTSCWFYGFSLVTTIEIDNLDTSATTNMSYMFVRCNELNSLDLSNFNTKNVTNMESMFSACSMLKSLNISNFNTSNVTTMTGMFSGCYNLLSLDVSSFDTSKVTKMSSMFSGCNMLKTIFASKNFISVKSNYVFMDDYMLVGGNGTKYNESHTNGDYARIDNPPSAPGYFTEKTPPL